MNKPKISVITISFKNRKGLKNTIRSVVEQDYENLEYIVIDGGSKDGSRELLQEYDEKIDFWVSEPDKGIYNAMNKGVEHAGGKYCIFMNSGDTFCNSRVLSEVFEHDYEEDVISGIGHVGKDLWIPIKKEEISLFHFFISGLCHQATFIKTDVLRKIPYDETQPIVGDSKFFIESIIINNCTYTDIDKEVCVYELGGISNDSERQKNEIKKVFLELFPEKVVKDYEKFAELYLLRKLNPLMKKLKRLYKAVRN